MKLRLRAFAFCALMMAIAPPASAHAPVFGRGSQVSTSQDAPRSSARIVKKSEDRPAGRKTRARDRRDQTSWLELIGCLAGWCVAQA